MSDKRRDPRINCTEDLAATLRPPGRARIVASVLDLSVGGMLLGMDYVDVGRSAPFLLAGSTFQFAGIGQVVHRTRGATGVRFLRWEGQAGHAIHDLVATRAMGTGPAARNSVPPWLSQASRRATSLDPRKYDRVSVSTLWAVVAGPAGHKTAYLVLNVSEYGMLIDNAALPLGAQIDFVLEDRPFSYAGHGHIVHRTGAGAGVAVDRWRDAPEAIRALVRRAAPAAPIHRQVRKPRTGSSPTGPRRRAQACPSTDGTAARGNRVSSSDGDGRAR